MKNVNFDLNAMGVEEMAEKEVLSVDGGQFYIDGIPVSEGAFRAWAKANDVELTDDTWLIGGPWPNGNY